MVFVGIGLLIDEVVVSVSIREGVRGRETTTLIANSMRVIDGWGGYFMNSCREFLSEANSCFFVLASVR